MGKVNGGKVKSCSRINYGNGSLAVRENEVRRTWNDNFEDLYNMNKPLKSRL